MQLFLNMPRLLLLCLMLGWLPVAVGQSLHRELSASAAPGASTALRLERVAVGTELQLAMSSTSLVDVLVLDAYNFLRFPDISQSLFAGKIERELEVNIRPAASGDYYLVFLNRQKQGAAAKIELSLKVTSVVPAPISNETLQARMNGITGSLGKLFVYDGIHIQPSSCGFANLLAVEQTVYLCMGYVTALRNSADDADKAKSLLLFGLLHEIGHLLLQQWDMPFYGNEELADQFATVLAGMIGRPDSALAQADFFASQVTSRNDRRNEARVTHPGVGSRAANIRRWTHAGPEHLAAWMPFLMPHMQEGFLRQLLRSPTDWASVGAIEKELRSRNK